MFVFQGKTRDIIEMTLHEIITIYLYGGCYIVNYWEIGSVISLIHGVSDILIMASKVMSETNHGNITAGIFVSAMIVWFYTRLVVFPWVAWYASV